MQGRNRKVSLLIFIYLVVPVEKCSTTFSALLDIRMTYLPTFWSKKKPTESRRIMYLFAYLNKASHVLNKNCLSGKATAKTRAIHIPVPRITVHPLKQLVGHQVGLTN